MSFRIVCECCDAESQIDVHGKSIEETGEVEIHCGDYIIDVIQCNKCGNKIASK